MKKWNHFQNQFIEKFEKKYMEDERVEDIEELGELIKITINDGRVFVINRQVPIEQVWLSSPVSGPTHFNYIEKDLKWVSEDGKEIFDLIEKDMKAILTRFN